MASTAFSDTPARGYKTGAYLVFQSPDSYHQRNPPPGSKKARILADMFVE